VSAAAVPLVSIRDLGVTYAGAREATHKDPALPALQGIDLDIAAGERLAVIGESGSGKSTLALAIAGLLPGTAEMAGRIRWFGIKEGLRSPPSVLPDISPSGGEISRHTGYRQSSTLQGGKPSAGLPISPLEGEMSGRAEGGGERHWAGIRTGSPRPGCDIGFVFQDPAASLDPVLTVGEQVAEVARAHFDIGWPEAYARAADLLARVRLPDPQGTLSAYPHQLSGGQKQRVAIAAAIAARPKLLIADEATSALDTIVQAEIVTLLRRLTEEDGMTLLFISHDIALAAGLADRIAVFRRGAMVELGTTAQVIEAPRDPYTRSLLDAHIGLDAAPLLPVMSKGDGR
jgi:peptide/nickel transport system ATP-binding protein